MEKQKTFIIRINPIEYEEYKKICKEHGFNISQKIRNFITNEIKIYKKNE